MVRNNIYKCMQTLCKKMHMDSCMRAYSTVQQLLCHGGYCELRCERCLLITESPKTPGHYRYRIWVLVYIPYTGLAVFSFVI